MEAQAQEPLDLPSVKPEESKEKPYPLKIVFCQKCGLPPEFCMFEKKKDLRQKCRLWLSKAHPQLYKSLYEQDPKEEETSAPKQEEKKEKKVHFSEQVQPAKPKKKGGAATASGQVTITKLKRGGKKFVTIIDGLQYHEIDLKEAAKALRKRFACGTNVQGKTVQVQGGFDQELTDFLSSTFPKIEKITTVDEGKQKKKGK